MENKNKFLQGALCGALGMFLIMGAAALIWFFVFRPVTQPVEEADVVISEETQQKIAKIEKLIEESYLYEEDVDSDALVEGILGGYVEALNDPYSEYYDEKATADMQESTQGEYSGIGAVLSQNMETKIVTITNVYDESPAEEAGIKSNDILYKVNGEDISGRNLTEVVSEIKGEEGTDVEITILRGEKAEEVTVTATRRKVEAQTIEYEMKAGDIGYIRITEFDAVTYDQYEAALNDLEVQGMKGLIVDLRSNPGGNLGTVCDILDLMLPEGTIVYTEDKYGEQQKAVSDEEHQFNKPLVVLVNGYSASASEIYAGAIQDYKLGQIVGTTTYGKGVVQQIFDLDDGTSVKLTISEYFTPEGRSINGTGIIPDVEVKYEVNADDEEADNQLDKGLEVVGSAIE